MKQHWPIHDNLTLLHSERPKLYAILVFLSAVGLKLYCPEISMSEKKQAPNVETLHQCKASIVSIYHTTGMLLMHLDLASVLIPTLVPMFCDHWVLCCEFYNNIITPRNKEHTEMQ